MGIEISRCAAPKFTIGLFFLQICRGAAPVSIKCINIMNKSINYKPRFIQVLDFLKPTLTNYLYPTPQKRISLKIYSMHFILQAL